MGRTQVGQEKTRHRRKTVGHLNGRRANPHPKKGPRRNAEHFEGRPDLPVEQFGGATIFPRISFSKRRADGLCRCFVTPAPGLSPDSRELIPAEKGAAVDILPCLFPPPFIFGGVFRRGASFSRRRLSRRRQGLPDAPAAWSRGWPQFHFVAGHRPLTNSKIRSSPGVRADFAMADVKGQASCSHLEKKILARSPKVPSRQEMESLIAPLHLCDLCVSAGPHESADRAPEIRSSTDDLSRHAR